ncbi:unnamed protein product [Cunninghamella blakesleeana]
MKISPWDKKNRTYNNASSRPNRCFRDQVIKRLFVSELSSFKEKVDVLGVTSSTSSTSSTQYNSRRYSLYELIEKESHFILHVFYIHRQE